MGKRNPGFDPLRVDDVILGVVSPVGDQGANLARTAALAAGYESSGRRLTPEGPAKAPGVEGRRARRRLMGTGSAYACARSGIDVVLRDVSRRAAERGKDYSRRLLDRAVTRGRLSEAGREEILARIAPSAEYADPTGCGLVVEAVFEDASLKPAIFAEAEKAVANDALLSSNTPRCRSPAWPKGCTGRRTSSVCTSSPPSARCSWWRSSAVSGRVTRP